MRNYYFNKMAGYCISLQKNQYINFLYSSKSHTEKDIIDIVPFKTASKNKTSGTKLNRRDEMLL